MHILYSLLYECGVIYYGYIVEGEPKTKKRLFQYKILLLVISSILYIWPFIVEDLFSNSNCHLGVLLLICFSSRCCAPAASSAAAAAPRKASWALPRRQGERVLQPPGAPVPPSESPPLRAPASSVAVHVRSMALKADFVPWASRTIAPIDKHMRFIYKHWRRTHR